MVSSNFSFFPLPSRADLLCFSSTAVVSNNVIGPAGQSYGTGPIADGISLACENSIVQDNELFGELSLVALSFPPPPTSRSRPPPSYPILTDITDGGIVIFSAPGSLISGNTITAINVSPQEKKMNRRVELSVSPFFPSPVCHARRNQHGRLRSLLWKL